MNETSKYKAFKEGIKNLFRICPKWVKIAYVIFLFINLFLLFASFRLDNRLVPAIHTRKDSKNSFYDAQWVQINPYRYYYPFSYTVAINGYSPSESHVWSTIENGREVDFHSRDFGIILPFDIITYDITDFLLYTLYPLLCIVICLLLSNPLSLCRRKERI